MTNKDREKLEAVLVPLRGRISKEDFIELATMHIQRAEDYIICSVKEFTADRICYECYETYYRVNGIVILSAEEKKLDLSHLLEEHGEYRWWAYYRYHDNVDLNKMLLWLQRSYRDLPRKYWELGDWLYRNLPDSFDKKYGWWEKEDGGEWGGTGLTREISDALGKDCRRIA